MAIIKNINPAKAKYLSVESMFSLSVGEKIVVNARFFLKPIMAKQAPEIIIDINPRTLIILYPHTI